MSERLEFELRASLARFELNVAHRTSARSLGLFGASGAGKTTLVEALAGWRAVEAGRIEVGGERWLDTARGVNAPPSARRAGYVPQDLLLFPHLDVAANLRFAGVADERLYERVLDVLEIGALRGRDVASLSGGERQRVALGRALCAAPRLLLLDEPLGALDRPLRRRILPYLIRVRDEFDVPMVLVSHDPTEIAAACDEVLVLREGRVVARGVPDETLALHDGGERIDDEFENVLHGRVAAVTEGTASIDLGGATLETPRSGMREGDGVLVAVRASDVLVAATRPIRLSARNVLAARIERVERGPAARLRAKLADQSLWIDLTDAAIDELDLRAGGEAFLVIKTRACRVLGRRSET